ncbi:MAG: chromosomal replication initiator protein DnaA [Flavobacteriales bacterium]
MKKTPEQVWNSCLSAIKTHVSPQSFKTWFEPIQALELNGTTLKILVPNNFFYEWLEEHYIDLLRQTISAELGDEAKLLYVLPAETHSRPSETKATQETIRSSTAEVKASRQADEQSGDNPFYQKKKSLEIDPQLNANYDFDSFIEGDANRLARSAAFAIAQKPGGTSFNPLLLYGGVGLGKTHLANAIGVEIKGQFPEKTVLYVSAERFTQQFIQSIRNNNRNNFVHFYETIDVLIIDDVQFFSGKEKTQDVFFHIFNHLHRSGKQLILTSDRAPVDMQGMEQRLLSRFKWGLSADLQMPAYETRLAILQSFLDRNAIEIPFDVVDFLALHVKTNIRELEGVLISLVAHATLNSIEYSVELAKSILNQVVQTKSKPISIDAIQKEICQYFDISLDLMLSKSRKRHLVQARQLAMYFSKKYTNSSLLSIGKQHGGKDHATVLYACRAIKNLLETDKQFSAFAKDIETRLHKF